MHSHASETYSPPLTAAARLLSIREVANVLGVHRNTVHRLVNAGELHPVRIGRLPRFRPGDVEAFLERSAAP